MKTVFILALAGAVLAQQPQPYTAARYSAGGVPGLAPMTVGPGEAIVELTVGASGRVENVKQIRTIPPYTDMLTQVVRGWTFTPAIDDPVGPDGKPQGPRPVASKVLAVALYRAPTLLTPTQGQQPATVASASPDVAFPSATILPAFPPNAQFGGVVMIEARISATGVVSTRVVSSSPTFDDAAMQAARQWTFFPARVKDNAETYAYLIFGFPQPVTGR